VNLSWYDTAIKELGQREVKGDADNPRIIEYHKATTLRASHDEVPWCSSFVNWCFSQAGYTGTKSAAAASWLAWGTHITAPVRGCVAVITRPDYRKAGGIGHHVAFYDGYVDGKHIRILGGNQSDAVTRQVVDVSRVSAYLMPNHLDDDDAGTYELLKQGVA